MTEPRFPNFARNVARFGAAPTLLAMLLGTQPGCTREFFRDWANQDVSEAVFEKSRDPRWRLDMFSIEPPAMSRFADYSDQEFPPAPPDDIAAEALSPKPQSPDNRLLVPMEATGYIEMLERWRDEREAMPQPAEAGGPGAPAADRPAPTPPPSGGSSPFSPEGAPGTLGTIPELTPPPTPPPAAGPTTLKLGPRDPKAKPVLLADAGLVKAGLSVPPPRSAESFAKTGGPAEKAKSTVPPPRPAESFAQNKKDGDVRPAAMQNAEPNVSIRGLRPGEAENLPPGIQSPYVQPPAAVPLDPNPEMRDIGTPGAPRPDQIIPEGPEGMLSEEQASKMMSTLIPVVPPLNEAEAAGLPHDSRPYKVNMQQAFTLALINSRFYQSQLETLYSAALAVTLQRFAFQPQFYAGLGPGSPPPGGFPALNPGNVFNYRTRYAPGGQISNLQLGEIAGFGKVLSSGGQLVMGFANQVVFNFVGARPFQPTVQSSLPLTFVQPFLRGGGRAVVLEQLTLAERSLLYQVRAFAQFRQQFIVTILTGGSLQNLGAGFSLAGFTAAGNSDPVIGYIPLLINLEQIDINRKNVAYFEQMVNLYKQLIEGESSGLSKLQVDQTDARLVQSRQSLVRSILAYRSNLDQYKMQLGLPPDLPMVIDRSLTRGFLDVFGRIDDWQRDPDRDLADLPGLVDQVPGLQDVVIDGRSLLNLYRNSETYTDDDTLEDILQAGVRTALEYRLDLMNNRAQLYDAWRQIRFQANSLKGILNVGLTNQVATPPTTTNPFGFFSQATSFSLVLNAELPLIRLAERNNFRQSLINYQRQRRALQNAEDALKYQIRQDIRNLQIAYINYQIVKRNLVLNIQLKDQAFEQIVAPPAGAAGSSGVAQSANAATQTSNLINFQGQVVGSEQDLLTGWRDYQLARLSLYRDLGILPYDEWEAFSELFPAEYRGPSLGPGTGDARPAAAAAPETP